MESGNFLETTWNLKSTALHCRAVVEASYTLTLQYKRNKQEQYCNIFITATQLQGPTEPDVRLIERITETNSI